MIRTALRAHVFRRLFVGLALIAMSSAAGSGVLAAASPSASAPMSAAPAVASAPVSDAADTINALTPAESMGVQSINPGHFASGGSTVHAAGANFVHFGLSGKPWPRRTSTRRLRLDILRQRDEHGPAARAITSW